jgi:hypothetical protein
MSGAMTLLLLRACIAWTEDYASGAINLLLLRACIAWTENYAFYLYLNEATLFSKQSCRLYYIGSSRSQWVAILSMGIPEHLTDGVSKHFNSQIFLFI